MAWQKIQLLYAVSETEKAVNYKFLHPQTFRHCYYWFPKSLIRKHSPFNEISIPKWLWEKIEKKIS